MIKVDKEVLANISQNLPNTKLVFFEYRISPNGDPSYLSTCLTDIDDFDGNTLIYSTASSNLEVKFMAEYHSGGFKSAVVTNLGEWVQFQVEDGEGKSNYLYIRSTEVDTIYYAIKYYKHIEGIIPTLN
jgi:hypothetical protein